MWRILHNAASHSLANNWEIDMKLTVDTLDNEVKSAVINIGKDNGYIEAFLWEGVVRLNVFNKEGDVVHNYAITTKDLCAKGGWTAPKFEPAQEHYEGDSK
jgi:uncharacterized protein YheU (UPF0270 family)